MPSPHAPSPSKKEGDYHNLPDHSDLRGFSYRAPTSFDYHDELPKRGFWSRLLERLGLAAR